jgi:asparagine synthase (glutamine-hydrolysing)
MPGLVGLISKMPRATAEAQVRQMTAALRHEAFYATGTWSDAASGVYVGWSARMNSFSDGMPLTNERGDTVLFFSGEEYPEPGIARRLEQRGHTLEEHGASYLVHLAEEDPAFLSGLNGMFHGLLIDRTRGTATLFTDRYGMHRLYLHEAEDAFYFAAEAKAILAVRPELRRLDPRSLGEFIACGCILEDRTAFQGISLLPGGAAWVFRDGRIESRPCYFTPAEWEEQTPLAPEPFYRELREVFARNLPRYFQGPERVGISLTGGLDTRVILAWHQPAPGSLPCYTFGGTMRECQDVRVARRVARACQQSHAVIAVNNEFLLRFPHYAERSVYLTEGGVNVSRSSDLYLSEQARQIAPVKVVGTYGSEILRQAVMFKPKAPTPGLYHSDCLPAVRQAESTYAALRRQHPITFAAFRQSPWYHYPILALEQSQLGVRSPYLDRDFVRTVFRAPRMPAAEDIRLRLVQDGNPALARIPTDRGIGGSRGRFAAALSRAFLDFTGKAEYAYDYGMPQWLAGVDHAFAWCHFERLFLGWHKMLHFRVWYRDQLSEYVRAMLLDPVTRSRPYLDREGLEAMVHSHLAGRGNHTTDIHTLLTLELLHRQFLD